VDMEMEAEVVLPDRNEKHTLRTKVRIMSMLSMAVIPEKRRALGKGFASQARRMRRGTTWNKSLVQQAFRTCVQFQSVGL
jgi:hypothetical protein